MMTEKKNTEPNNAVHATLEGALSSLVDNIISDHRIDTGEVNLLMMNLAHFGIENTQHVRGLVEAYLQRELAELMEQQKLAEKNREYNVEATRITTKLSEILMQGAKLKGGSTLSFADMVRPLNTPKIKKDENGKWL